LPKTTPVVEPTEATDALLLLHVPPEVASLKDTVEPSQTLDGPVMDAGNGLIVITAVDTQLVGNV
jgi:hypothetical protein